MRSRVIVGIARVWRGPAIPPEGLATAAVEITRIGLGGGGDGMVARRRYENEFIVERAPDPQFFLPYVVLGNTLYCVRQRFDSVSSSFTHPKIGSGSAE